MLHLRLNDTSRHAAAAGGNNNFALTATHESASLAHNHLVQTTWLHAEHLQMCTGPLFQRPQHWWF